MRVVGDCEANGLYNPTTGEKPTVFHCAVFKDLDSGVRIWFVPNDWIGRAIDYCKGKYEVRGTHRLPAFLDQCTEIWMHNALGYDRKLIQDIFGYRIPLKKLKDSLILSRLGNHAARHKFHPRLRKEHSVEAWARWLSLPVQKVKHEDWSKFSLEMLHRCDTDVEIQENIVCTIQEELKDYPAKVITEEMLFADLLQEQHDNGFYLYRNRAQRFYDKYREEANDLQEEIRKAFPPKRVLVKSFKARFRQPKTKEEKTWSPTDPRLMHKVDVKYLEDRGLPLTTLTFEEYQDEEFNIGSPKQRVERLLENGWEPIEFTPTGAPKSPKADCPSLQNPALPREAQLIGKWLVKDNRANTIKQWLDSQGSDGYVHGRIINIGAWTNRCAHVAPNMGNVPGRVDIAKGISKSDVVRMRSCWGVKPETHVRLHDDMPVLVGCDAAGIQGRALAHYIALGTGEHTYINLVSDPKVDLHEYNKEAAGLKSRSQAKTFYYSYVLGVGYWKIAKQVGVDPSDYEELLEFMKAEGIKETLERSMVFTGVPLTDENFAISTRGYQIREGFEDNVPGLRKFKHEYIPSVLKSKRVYLPDGRYLAVDKKPEVMAAMLQGFETVVMRRTGLETVHRLRKEGIPHVVRNFVHDEYQYETKRRYAERLKEIFQQSIEDVRNMYGILCPLGVDVKPRKDISISWAGTH